MPQQEVAEQRQNRREKAAVRKRRAAVVIDPPNDMQIPGKVLRLLAPTPSSCTSFPGLLTTRQQNCCSAVAAVRSDEWGRARDPCLVKLQVFREWTLDRSDLMTERPWKVSELSACHALTTDRYRHVICVFASITRTPDSFPSLTMPSLTQGGALACAGRAACGSGPSGAR